MTCTHPTPQWRLTGCNENGWHCPDCDKPYHGRSEP